MLSARDPPSAHTMSGKGSKQRRSQARLNKQKAKLDKQKQRQKLGDAQITTSYPYDPNAKFWIWGETVTFRSTVRSQYYGPFSHIRIATSYVFVSNESPSHEDLIAWLDSDTSRWVFNERQQNAVDYYEVIISAKDPSEL